MLESSNPLSHEESDDGGAEFQENVRLIFEKLARMDASVDAMIASTFRIEATLNRTM